MPRPERCYKEVIVAVHGRRRVAFAVHEIAKESGSSAPSVKRLFKRLEEMGLLRQYPRGFNNRIWRVRRKWPMDGPIAPIIQAYEYWQLASGDHTVNISN